MIIIVENTAAGRQGAGAAVESLPTYQSSTWQFRELTGNAVGF